MILSDLHKPQLHLIKNKTYSVYYEIEKGRGIPFARNNVLRRAKSLAITELIFIDDDETVDIDWLVNLWNYYLQNNVDVVRLFRKSSGKI